MARYEEVTAPVEIIVRDKSGEKCNALSYGIKNDGTESDPADIAAWLTAAAGRKAYLPDGDYLFPRFDASGYGYNQILGESANVEIRASQNGGAGEAFLQLGTGSGGTGGSHPTANRHTLLENITLLANGYSWDYGVYADRLIDSKVDKLRIYMGDVGLHVNYSWLSSFHDLDVQYFQSVGVQLTNFSTNGLRFYDGRLSGANSPAGVVGWDIQGGNTILIASDCEACDVGMRLGAVKSILIATHFEGCTSDQLLYNYGNVQSGPISIVGSTFYQPGGNAIRYDTSSGTQIARALNVHGNRFDGVSAGEVQLLAESGRWYGNDGDSGIITQHSSNRMRIEVQGREHQDRAFDDSTRISTFSTSSGSPSTLFTNIPAGCAFTITAQQRLSGTNTSGWRRSYTVAEDGTLNGGTADNFGPSALGIVLSYSGGTLSAYGTYASAIDFRIEVTGRASTI